MASWLQAQLKVAEGLLDAVDKTVSKNLSLASTDDTDTASTSKNFEPNINDITLTSNRSYRQAQRSLPHSTSSLGSASPASQVARQPLHQRSSSDTQRTDAFQTRSGPSSSPADQLHTHSSTCAPTIAFSAATHPPSLSNHVAAQAEQLVPSRKQPGVHSTAPAASTFTLLPNAARSTNTATKAPFPITSTAAVPASKQAPATAANLLALSGTGATDSAGSHPMADTGTPPPAADAQFPSSMGADDDVAGHAVLPTPKQQLPEAAATPQQPPEAAAALQQPADSQQAHEPLPQLVREQQLMSQLRRRVEQLKSENEQLEDMLHKAEQRAAAERHAAEQLADDLRAAANNRDFSESTLQAQLVAQQQTMKELASKADTAQRAAVRLEAQVALLQESNALLAQSKNEAEGGMLEALKAEVASAEQRLAAEHRAHQATRAAAAARERDLEQHLGDSSVAFANAQRSLEVATARGRELEEELALSNSARNELEDRLQQVISLQQLANSEGGAVTATNGMAGRLRPSDARGSSRQLESDSLHSEIQQLRRTVAAAEAAHDGTKAQLQESQQQLESLQEALSNQQDTSTLEARLQEVSDMLLIKQSQMERLAGDKAAQQLRVERELQQARDELVRLRASSSSHAVTVGYPGGCGGGSTGGVLRADMVPMDALGEPYQRLARHRRVGKAFTVAANLLDSAAATTAFFLRQYPLGRLAVFGYLLLMHLWMYLVIARMQRQALSLELVGAST